MAAVAAEDRNLGALVVHSRMLGVVRRVPELLRVRRQPRQ